MCKKQDTIPLDLVGMAPGEVLSLDYANILSKNVLVLKDKATGHIMAELPKDKSTESVEKFLMRYFSHYGLQYKIISDVAGCQGLHIETHHTSAYRSPSNCNVERVIGQIRTAVERINNLNTEILMKVVLE